MGKLFVIGVDHGSRVGDFAPSVVIEKLPDGSARVVSFRIDRSAKAARIAEALADLRR